MANKVNIHDVPVLIGASTHLVAHRELRNKYSTNRSIKCWSTFFLLKHLSTSGHIQHWIRQKEYLLEYLQCNEQTFRSRIKELQRLKLLQILPGYCLQLTSYRKAASILDIDFCGLQKITYDQSIKGTNVFAYMLTADEIRINQETQREAISYHLDKNPLLLDLLLQLLQQQGCDLRQLREDPVFFQEQLLKLQETSFKQGSDILKEIMRYRADVNRGMRKIAEDHAYKHKRSVSYLKRVLEKLGIVRIVKRFVLSEAKSRRYLPDGNSKRDGYMWLKKARATMWNLCDQLIINSKFFKKNETKETLAAAVAA